MSVFWQSSSLWEYGLLFVFINQPIIILISFRKRIHTNFFLKIAHFVKLRLTFNLSFVMFLMIQFSFEILQMSTLKIVMFVVDNSNFLFLIILFIQKFIYKSPFLLKTYDKFVPKIIQSSFIKNPYKIPVRGLKPISNILLNLIKDGLHFLRT